MADLQQQFCVYLNVGGERLTTTLKTLKKYPDSLLATMFDEPERSFIPKDNYGSYFIDRNGKAFGHILEFLRDETYLPPKEIQMEVYKEAKYYRLRKLQERLEKLPEICMSNHLSLIDNKIRYYLQVRSKVMELALQNSVKTFETECKPDNSILLGTYQQHGPFDSSGIWTQASSSDDVWSKLTQMVTSQYNDSALWENSSQINNVDYFIQNFLQDRQQENYVVSYEMLPIQMTHGVKFENVIFVPKQGALLTFKWNFLPVITKLHLN